MGSSDKQSVREEVSAAMTAAACAVGALALVDLLLLVFHAESHVGRASLQVLGAWGGFFAVAGVVIACLGVLGARRRSAPRPNDPLVLGLFVLVGAYVVHLNESTFSGEGLARSGFATPIRLGSLAAELAFLFVVIHHLAARRWRRSTLVSRLGLPLAAVVLIGADRLLFRGQYPQVHRQLFLIGNGLLIASVTGCGCAASRGIAGRAAASFLLLFVVITPWSLGGSGAAALSTVATTPRLGAGTLLDIGAGMFPIGGRIEAADVDASFILKPTKGNPQDVAAAYRDRARLEKPPNIILVSIDTVRADHVGHHGYSRHPVSPEWDAIARDSIVFENAYTAYPTSNLAYSALFTSRWPAESPAETGAPAIDGFALASLLGGAGYRSLAVTAFIPGTVEPGGGFTTFRRGFDRFEALGEPRVPSDALRMVPRILEVLDAERTAVSPVFLWVHFFDPHHPYESRDGFDFGDDKVDRYDAEIAVSSRALGRLRDGLIERGLWDESVLIVHSDHGESFGEHDTEFHNSSVYEEQVHVPLLIHGPGLAPARHAETVSLVDLLPTLATLAGVPDPHEKRRRGRDLSDLLLERRPDGGAGSGHAFCQLVQPFFPSIRRQALVLGRMKIIVAPAGIPQVAIHDLEADPRELENIVGRDSTTDARMLGLLETIKGAIEN